MPYSLGDGPVGGTVGGLFHRANAWLAVLIVLVAAVTESHHDYKLYESQWSTVLSGRPPLERVYEGDTGFAGAYNAYGPFHGVFSLPFAVQRHLPRVIFAVLFVALWVVLLPKRQCWSTSSDLVTWCTLRNPFFWISTVIYGQNDVVAAFFLVLALYLLDSGKHEGAGLLLGLAVLEKIYPLVIVPFLALNDGKLNKKLLISLALTVLNGYVISWLLLGDNVFFSFFYSVERESKLMSIFMFLRGKLSPLRLVMENPNVDWLSLYVVGAFVLSVTWAHIRFRWDFSLSSLLALVGMLTFYKVGHFQFQASAIFLACFACRRLSQQGARMPALRRGIIIYAGWFALATVLYSILGNFFGRFELIREFIGLPTFAVQVWFMWIIAVTAQERVVDRFA